ncbi:cupin domain-containing protein [Robertkochia aurantiaca]|uniref:cupin domain-containing protein n=1 Tax=Robertkochia aurantiaca TaxID=2873700 RepID=UPI001CCB3475|nr:cupin domain-containing protein [Robertkochia sp. 3YJGBD-33]
MRTLIHLKRKTSVLVTLLLMGSIMTFYAQQPSSTSMLQEFVDSYKTDPMAHSAYFGIKIGDQWWHVWSERKQEDYKVGKNKEYTFHSYGPHKVSLAQGKPERPTWYFELADENTLSNLHSGKWNAATASARSTADDMVPLQVKNMEGFDAGIKEDAIVYEVMEHFWKKDPVEITYFSRDGSLPTHGVDHVGLYTMKDKRIGWFSIGPEQAANAERGLDKGQVPNLFIITKGRGEADFGNGPVELKPGMSVFVPPYMKHVIYNPHSEPLEGIVILFGDNIDFAEGKSYMDFLEEQHDFYQRYDPNVQN